MTRLAPLFSSESVHWTTPTELYAALDREFQFTLDPCPEKEVGGLFGQTDGLLADWSGHRPMARRFTSGCERLKLLRWRCFWSRPGRIRGGSSLVGDA